MVYVVAVIILPAVITKMLWCMWWLSSFFPLSYSSSNNDSIVKVYVVVVSILGNCPTVVVVLTVQIQCVCLTAAVM